MCVIQVQTQHKAFTFQKKRLAKQAAEKLALKKEAEQLSIQVGFASDGCSFTWVPVAEQDRARLPVFRLSRPLHPSVGCSQIVFVT